MNARNWLTGRLRHIQAKLAEVGPPVSLPVSSRLLKGHDYRLRLNRKEAQGADHPDRDRQFTYIQEQRAWFPSRGQRERHPLGH